MSVSKTEFKFDVSKLLELYNNIQIPKDNTLDQNQISITSFDGKQLYVDNKFNEDYIRYFQVYFSEYAQVQFHFDIWVPYA